jgi:glutaminyl-peptide cyclotransferase
VSSRLAISAAALVIVAIGCGSQAPAHDPVASRHVDRFNVRRAWHLVERQVAVGQRPAGSPQLRALAVRLRRLLPRGRFEAVRGQPGLRNVVGTLRGRRPGIVIGAHYDTLVQPRGFVGANNGAAGTAVVIEAARALRRLPPRSRPREIKFVLFDGEEPRAGLPEDSVDFYYAGLRGSRSYARAHRGQANAMILLDYVAGKGLQLPREGSSDPGLWKRVRSAARKVGASRFFPDDTGETITDDHTPFLRQDVAAVDLIDWSYPGHDLSDRLDRLSRRSLDAVGETVVQLARDLEASR